MNNTKTKLSRGETVFGGWIMIGHPSVAEVMAGEGFDWLGVDMEHTSISIREFHELALAVQGTDVDLLARLPGHDPDLAKRLLDSGAVGIIVPGVNTPDDARRAVAMAKFPPAGTRGASLCRATDFGRNFEAYYRQHNDNVLVVCMLEHVDAVANVEAILETPGLDATLIGPYDLSASMDLPGQLDHPDVQAAQQTIVDACKDHGVPAGIHVVEVDEHRLRQRVDQGFRFVACGIDTAFLMHGCRTMLGGRVRRAYR